MKAAFWFLLLCSLAHGAACPTGQAKNEATLVQMENTWARAVEQHDMPGLECILATEFEEAGTTGQLTVRSQMLATAAGYGKVHYELSELHATSMAISHMSAGRVWP